MKTSRFFSVAVFLLGANFLIAQNQNVNTADSTGLPGDHFSLEGALDLFKSSNSLEDFEKKLNIEDNSVNNLDLNGDGQTDYIRVIDNKKDDAHAIVLQVPVNKTESQDVAVIEIEKTGNSDAIVQIIGDEELYGENKIVEPFDEKENSKAKSGPSNYYSMPVRVFVNVWMWPCIQFIFAPAYVVWVSPWSWDYYPPYWRPWRPHPWRYHYMHCYHYNQYYYHVHKNRVPNAHQIYAPRRAASATVNHRYSNVHSSYNAHRASNPNQNVTTRPRPAGNLNQNVNPQHRQINQNHKVSSQHRQVISPNKVNKRPATINNQSSRNSGNRIQGSQSHSSSAKSGSGQRRR